MQPEARPDASSPASTGAWPMWALGLVLMVDQVDQNIVRGIVPQLKDEFHLGDWHIGLLMSVFVLVNATVTVPAGYLADRWRRTRAIGNTVVAWSAVTALTALAHNFGQLLVLRSVLGFGQAVTEPSAASLMSDYYPTHQRGRAFSLQQVLNFAGIGLGVGLGGAIGSTVGWRWAFLVVGAPGTLVAVVAYRLSEPRRGHGERLHLGIEDDGSDDGPGVRLFEGGVRQFVRDLNRGLVADFRTILSIPTLRLSLIGVGVLLFTVQAIAAWLPEFHRRFSGLTQAEATTAFMLMVLFAGIPGVLTGGRVADRYAGRIQGARVVIPAYCIWIGTSAFTASYLPMPFAASMALEMVGFFVVTMSIPALRAGITDVVPANLRGAGFGAFNLVAVVFGAAAAPLVVGSLADVWNLRTAFLVISPTVYVGGYVLYRARYHLDEDAAKIFEAVLRAIQERQAEQEAMGAGEGEGAGEGTEAVSRRTESPATGRSPS